MNSVLKFVRKHSHIPHRRSKASIPTEAESGKQTPNSKSNINRNKQENRKHKVSHHPSLHQASDKQQSNDNHANLRHEPNQLENSIEAGSPNQEATLDPQKQATGVRAVSHQYKVDTNDQLTSNAMVLKEAKCPQRVQSVGTSKKSVSSIMGGSNSNKVPTKDECTVSSKSTTERHGSGHPVTEQGPIRMKANSTSKRPALGNSTPTPPPLPPPPISTEVAHVKKLVKSRRVLPSQRRASTKTILSPSGIPPTPPPRPRVSFAIAHANDHNKTSVQDDFRNSPTSSLPEICEAIRAAASDKEPDQTITPGRRNIQDYYKDSTNEFNRISSLIHQCQGLYQRNLSKPRWQQSLSSPLQVHDSDVDKLVRVPTTRRTIAYVPSVTLLSERVMTAPGFPISNHHGSDNTTEVSCVRHFLHLSSRDKSKDVGNNNSIESIYIIQRWWRNLCHTRRLLVDNNNNPSRGSICSQSLLSNRLSQVSVSKRPSEVSVSNRLSQVSVSKRPSEVSVSNRHRQGSASKRPSEVLVSNRHRQGSVSKSLSQVSVRARGGKRTSLNSDTKEMIGALHGGEKWETTVIQKSQINSLCLPIVGVFTRNDVIALLNLYSVLDKSNSGALDLVHICGMLRRALNCSGGDTQYTELSLTHALVRRSIRELQGIQMDNRERVSPWQFVLLIHRQFLSGREPGPFTMHLARQVETGGMPEKAMRKSYGSKRTTQPHNRRSDLLHAKDVLSLFILFDGVVRSLYDKLISGSGSVIKRVNTKNLVSKVINIGHEVGVENTGTVSLEDAKKKLTHSWRRQSSVNMDQLVSLVENDIGVSGKQGLGALLLQIANGMTPCETRECM